MLIHEYQLHWNVLKYSTNDSLLKKKETSDRNCYPLTTHSTTAMKFEPTHHNHMGVEKFLQRKIPKFFELLSVKINRNMFPLMIVEPVMKHHSSVAYHKMSWMVNTITDSRVKSFPCVTVSVWQACVWTTLQQCVTTLPLHGDFNSKTPSTVTTCWGHSHQ